MPSHSSILQPETMRKPTRQTIHPQSFSYPTCTNPATMSKAYPTTSRSTFRPTPQKLLITQLLHYSQLLLNSLLLPAAYFLSPRLSHWTFLLPQSILKATPTPSNSQTLLQHSTPFASTNPPVCLCATANCFKQLDTTTCPLQDCLVKYQLSI